MGRVIFLIVFFIVLGLIGAFIAELQYGSFEAYLNRKEVKCETSLVGATLVYSDVKKDYAIKIKNQYLSKFKHYYDLTSDPYDSFRDSCVAKAFFYQYQRDLAKEKKEKESYK